MTTTPTLFVFGNIVLLVGLAGQREWLAIAIWAVMIVMFNLAYVIDRKRGINK